tara:strand:- start:6165 stop:6641 length:477 start_codon:yes stop_codon:yes gene_type:complete
MSIKEALDLFKNLLADTTQKRETKLYKKFIGLLSGLNEMKLEKEKEQQIEEYIEGLRLNAIKERRHRAFTKKYREFTDYLKTKFSFVTEGYYTAVGLSLGLSFGAGLGVTFGSIGGGLGISMGISFGAGIGLVVGMLVGNHLDKEAKENGKVIFTNID